MDDLECQSCTSPWKWQIYQCITDCPSPSHGTADGTELKETQTSQKSPLPAYPLFRECPCVQNGLHHQQPAPSFDDAEQVVEDQSGIFIRPVLQDVFHDVAITPIQTHSSTMGIRTSKLQALLGILGGCPLLEVQTVLMKRALLFVERLPLGAYKRWEGQ